MPVEFQDEGQVTKRVKSPKGPSVLTRFIISLGVAKTEKEAQRVFLILAIVLIVIAAAFMLLGGVHDNPAPPVL